METVRDRETAEIILQGARDIWTACETMRHVGATVGEVQQTLRCADRLELLLEYYCNEGCEDLQDDQIWWVGQTIWAIRALAEAAKIEFDS